MLNAAKLEDWERFSSLDSVWQKSLQSASEKFGSDLNVIAQQLLEDNQKIQEIVKQAQLRLTNELHKNNQSHSSVKQYLK